MLSPCIPRGRRCANQVVDGNQSLIANPSPTTGFFFARVNTADSAGAPRLCEIGIHSVAGWEKWTGTWVPLAASAPEDLRGLQGALQLADAGRQLGIGSHGGQGTRCRGPVQ